MSEVGGHTHQPATRARSYCSGYWLTLPGRVRQGGRGGLGEREGQREGGRERQVGGMGEWWGTSKGE